MKVTRKDGETACVLSQVERTVLERSYAILEQLAYHYRNAELGNSMQLAVDSIDVLMLDKEVVPNAAPGTEQIEESPHA